MVEKNIDVKIKFPDAAQITTVTYATKEVDCLIQKQFDNSNLPIVNLAANHEDHWKNTLKILYLYEFLKSVNTKYVMSLDGIDVLAAQDLSGLLEKFAKFDCDILYGATVNNFPPDLPSIPQSNTLWPYLNCGTMIGRTEALIPFYASIVDDMHINYGKYNDSEQGRIKRKLTSNVKFDWKCEIFQTLNQIKQSYKNKTLFIEGLRCNLAHPY